MTGIEGICGLKENLTKDPWKLNETHPIYFNKRKMQ